MRERFREICGVDRFHVQKLKQKSDRKNTGAFFHGGKFIAAVISPVASGLRAIPYHSFDRCNYPRHAVPYCIRYARAHSLGGTLRCARCVYTLGFPSSRETRLFGERGAHAHRGPGTCRKYFQVCPPSLSSPVPSRHARRSRDDMRTEYGKPDESPLGPVSL